VTGKRSRNKPVSIYAAGGEGAGRKRATGGGDGGGKRRVTSSSSSSSSSRRSKADERPLNPFCTSGKKNCYCRSGRARAVYRVDAEGNVLEEYCSQSNAAAKLGLAGCSVNHVLNGHAPSARGHLFRYKQEGEMFMRRPKPVLLIDEATGEVLREFESAKAASNYTGVGNSTIGQCCAGKLESAGGYVFRFKDAKAAAVRQMELSMIGADPEEDREATPEEVTAARSIGVEAGKTEIINYVKGYAQIGVVTSVRIPQHVNRAATKASADGGNTYSDGGAQVGGMPGAVADGAAAAVMPAAEKPSFQVGDRVEALFHGQPDEYFPGTVTAANDAHTFFSIAYDDGDSETDVRTEYMRLRMPSSSAVESDEGSSDTSGGGDALKDKGEAGGNADSSLNGDTAEDAKSLLERAWFYVRFYDGCKATYQAHELEPKIIVPPPVVAPLPPPPTEGSARWDFEELNRVVRCDVSGIAIVDPVDEAYLCKIMDRPDVTLIIKGLSEGLSPHLWSESYLRARCGNLMLHKLRCFRRVPMSVAGPASAPSATAALAVAAETGEGDDSASASGDKKEEESSEKDDVVQQESLETNWKSMKLDVYWDYLKERDAAYRMHGAPSLVRDEGSSTRLKPPPPPPLPPLDPVTPSTEGDKAAAGSVAAIGHGNEHEVNMAEAKGSAVAEAPTSALVVGTDTSANGHTLDDATLQTHGPIKTVLNHEGSKVNIPVLDEGIYMIDFDLPKFLPELLQDLERNFKLDFLPRGQRCLLRFQPLKGHPFMGPNLYVTPPGSFTHFHQDGHGTVDSGHQCLRGRNEVIMLRRLDEKNKRRALRILCGSAVGYDALYGKPHDAGEKPPWPKANQIEQLRQLGYCPSVFTLHPGEYVHINKGRLHAFRKRAPPLTRKQQAQQRKATLDTAEEPATKKLKVDEYEDEADSDADGDAEQEEFCVSVAWDWVYQGSSRDGVTAEVAEPLQCAAHNVREGVPSLGHIEGAILQASLASVARQKAVEAREARMRAHLDSSGGKGDGKGNGNVVATTDAMELERAPVASGGSPIAVAVSAERSSLSPPSSSFCGSAVLPGAPDAKLLLDGLKPALKNLVEEQSRLVNDVIFATAHGHYKSQDSAPYNGNGERMQAMRLTSKRGGGSTTTSSLAPTAPTVTSGNPSDVTEDTAGERAADGPSSDTSTPLASSAAEAQSSSSSSSSVTAAAAPLKTTDCARIFSFSGDTCVDVELAANASTRIVSSTRGSDGGAVKTKAVLMPVEMTAATTVAEDPFACDSYVCQGCQRELCNVYMQCTGCRLLLSPPRALNLCVPCHKTGLYKQSIAVDRQRLSTTCAHHTPKLALANAAIAAAVPGEITEAGSGGTSTLSTHPAIAPEPCSCRAAMCVRCKLCVSCQCACHLDFQMRHRFMPPEALCEIHESIYG
jgi:hypothetical protein